MAAELGSYKQAHTSSPPLTLGNSRVVEGPAPLKELGSRAQAMHGGLPPRDEAPAAGGRRSLTLPCIQRGEQPSVSEAHFTAAEIQVDQNILQHADPAASGSSRCDTFPVLSPHLTQTSENDIASSLVVGTGTLPDRQNGDDPTASHPSTNNNNKDDERLDLILQTLWNLSSSVFVLIRELVERTLDRNRDGIGGLPVLAFSLASSPPRLPLFCFRAHRFLLPSVRRAGAAPVRCPQELQSAQQGPESEFSWKRQKEDGPLEELPPAEGEQLELRESGRTAAILLIRQPESSTYKYRCYVQHEGGTVEAPTEQEVSAWSQPLSSEYPVKLLSLLYSVLIVKSLVYCCGLSLLRILRNKGPSTNCTHTD
ncbi:hypothetical protein L3Q82_006007 [Scortum barcoo]|uniref:Uncharacterized protein n=1 Tax=Scortum barcoo TaxID=214431 RepID=A0ACB8X3P2_9TELE|nr:hypothetical protein L3Q82_006007 [Scortum barcoo]